MLEVESTLGADTNWVTWCGRPYPSLEYPDTPQHAPHGTPLCKRCLASPDRPEASDGS